MLSKLHIQNYAIIDEIEIQFSSGFNVITGETGAGKSILMGALGLILGERADSTALMNNQKKCVIEGYFSVQHKTDVKQFLTANELDIEDELLLRREITANGKSRAFINDSPATVQQLKTLAYLLVDLHRQFDTLELGESGFQQQILDALAGNKNILPSYQTLYRQWLHSKKQLQELQQQKAAFNKELDYYQFLLTELEDLNLQENELENIEEELKVLSNSEDIKTTLTKVCYELKESEQPIVGVLKQQLNALQNYSTYHAGLQTMVERLQSSQIELLDISNELENINDSIHYDAKKIESINERLALGYKLLKKHSVTNTNGLLKIQQDLQLKLQAVLDIDTSIINAEKVAAHLLQQVEALAETISVSRNKATAPLQQKVNELLVLVGMPNARLKIEVTVSALNEFGKDAISFLFDANKSNRFEPIYKVASGGELSRLMLCIKSLVAESIDLPTLIFDEIDTGISGEAARQVGVIMKQLSTNRQIICITHQPQIAGKANAHFYVYKQIKNDAVKTNIKLLNTDESITAIAKMLSGEKPTAAAFENAREMMN